MIPNYFTPIKKKRGQNGEKLRQLNPASKVSKHGVSAASVYAINDRAKGIAFTQVPPDSGG